MHRQTIYRIYGPAFVSGLLYIFLAYFTPRTQFWQLLFLVSSCFGLYVFLCRQPLDFRTGLGIAIFLRLIFTWAIPVLSDDYFRFFWDGTLWLQGENPFLQLPSYYLEKGHRVNGLTQTLYHKLNSPHYYSVYPPACQYLFALVKMLAGANIYQYCVLLRLFIIAAEAGSLLVLRRILQQLDLPEKQLWYYGLNPLVILELTGNLHFEAFLIFFLLISLYYLLQSRTTLAAVTFSIAITVKLLPLVFLPPLLKFLGWKRFIVFTGLVAGVVFLSFLPFMSLALIQHLGESINLYFQKFEFNASIYYLLRWLGYLVSGYNLIAFIAPLLGTIVFFTIIYLTAKFRKEDYNLIRVFLLSLSVYFLLATVVHPWYLTILVALTSLTYFKYPLVWSFAAVLSYSAYQTATYEENLYLIALEYILVFTMLIYEFNNVRKDSRTLPKKTLAEK